MLKKSFVVIIAVIILSAMPLSVAASTHYTDSTTGVSFTVPNGWVETSLNENREILKAKFEPLSKDGASLMFGFYDAWSATSDIYKVGYTRSDLDHDMMKKSLTEENLGILLGIDNMNATQSNVFFNGVEYIQYYITTDMTVFDITVNVEMYYLIHCQNGYMCSFYYTGTEGSSHYQDFVTMMNSVTYPQLQSSSVDYSDSSETSSIYIPNYITDDYDYDYSDEYDTTDNDNGIVYFEDGEMKFDFLGFILSLIITIIIYSLPIVIYRYAIKKQPFPEKKAKKITIIYGIIAFIVMAILLGGAPGAAIILWSTINYKMLTKPSKYDVCIENTTNITNGGVNVSSRYDETIDAKESDIIEHIEPTVEITEQKIDETEKQFTKTVDDEPMLEQSPIIEKFVVEELKSNETTTPIKPTNNVSFCRKCGTRLTADSEFCHKCGTKVIRL